LGKEDETTTVMEWVLPTPFFIFLPDEEIAMLVGNTTTIEGFFGNRFLAKQCNT
jgi:hypothetical protein